jgi:hypothetical protein
MRENFEEIWRETPCVNTPPEMRSYALFNAPVTQRRARLRESSSTDHSIIDEPQKELHMTLALVVIVGTVWVIVSLPIALIIGRIPKLAERAELRQAQGNTTGAIGTITR